MVKCKNITAYELKNMGDCLEQQLITGSHNNRYHTERKSTERRRQMTELPTFNEKSLQLQEGKNISC